MKAIMISIKPKWVAKILNGEKTIEIRKTMPKCDLPIDVYIYCTKDTEKLFQTWTNSSKYTSIKINTPFSLNGKVVAKFTLRKVEEVFVGKENNHYFYKTKHLTNKKLRNKSCLNDKELLGYLNLEKGYAWHISNLVIFDKPKELSEFKTYKTYNLKDLHNCHLTLTKAPQSWCYVEASL